MFVPALKEFARPSGTVLVDMHPRGQQGCPPRRDRSLRG